MEFVKITQVLYVSRKVRHVTSMFSATVHYARWLGVLRNQEDAILISDEATASGVRKRVTRRVFVRRDVKTRHWFQYLLFFRKNYSDFREK